MTGSTERAQRTVLWQVLAINSGFFVAEAAFGVLARSLGLLADSLDMLADAVVYGLSLLAVAAPADRKRRIARGSGVLQLTLAVVGLVEVVRRALGAGGPPDAAVMMVVAVLALGGNVLSLRLLARARSDEAHMRASVIFTSNDVVANLGVVVAGALVALTASRWPDLVVGTLVFAVVGRGALRILRLAR